MPRLEIQIQERARRRREMKKMRGLLTPKHATQRWTKISSEPVFKSMPRKIISPWDLALGFLSLLPWFRRRRREAELWQKQEAQSLKDKGVT